MGSVKGMNLSEKGTDCERKRVEMKRNGRIVSNSRGMPVLALDEKLFSLKNKS